MVVDERLESFFLSSSLHPKDTSHSSLQQKKKKFLRKFKD